MVQWLRLTVQGMWVQSLMGELRSHVSKKPNRKQKQKYNKFNKDFKTGPHQKKKKKKKPLKESLVKKK